MKFKKLTEKDMGLICEKYLEGKRQDADRFLSDHFNVSERTIRSWAKKLNLTGEDAKEISVNEPEIISTHSDEWGSDLVLGTSGEKPLVKDASYYWGLLEEPNLLKSPIAEYYPRILHEAGGKRVLVIGDIHAPFDLTEYLHHCKRVYDMFQCDTVVFIGDIIDNHYSSFHNTDPNGMGGGDELDYAIARIQRYYAVFPNAYVIIGNHDRMTARKAFAGGVPRQWIKDYHEVLQVPNWKFVTELELDNVLYFHGEGGTAKTRYKSEEQSTIQGHLHTQAYIEWLFSKTARKFAMQVGTGIDFSKYAFAYAKAGKKPAISCGVVINGKYPFLLPMDL